MLGIRSEIIALAAAAALAGCGGTSAGSTNSTQPNVTTCGIPYTFAVGGRIVSSGSCAGTFAKHPPSITVRPGGQFSLLIAGKFPVPKPTGSAVVIGKVNGQTVRYQAKRAGRARLTVRSEFCPSDPKVSTCSVLTVSVSPTGISGNTRTIDAIIALARKGSAAKQRGKAKSRPRSVVIFGPDGEVIKRVRVDGKSDAPDDEASDDPNQI